MHEDIFGDSKWCDLKSYFDRLEELTCAEGEVVPFKSNASIDEWRPAIGDCHRNADRWATAHPHNPVVQGWGTWGRNAGRERKFFAHSVLSEGSKLFDITPFGNEGERCGMIFVRHIGTDEEFFEIEKRCCFCSYPQDFLVQALSNAPPTGDEEEYSEGLL